MTGSIYGYTTVYRFKLVNYDTRGWHTYEYQNWRALDGLLGFMNAQNFKGVWENNASYTTNDLVVDDATGAMYKALVTHTSSATGSFATYRAANPTHWQAASQSDIFLQSNRLLKRARSLNEAARAALAQAQFIAVNIQASVDLAASYATAAQGAYNQQQEVANTALLVNDAVSKVKRAIRGFDPANSTLFAQVFS